MGLHWRQGGNLPAEAEVAVRKRGPRKGAVGRSGVISGSTLEKRGGKGVKQERVEGEGEEEGDGYTETY